MVAEFHHQALLYRDDQTYLAGLTPFVAEGLAEREPVMVAVPSRRIDLLRSSIGASAPDLRFEAMEDIGRNPAWIIAAWQDFLEAHAGASCRGIAEPVYPGRSPAEMAECQRHEVLMNVAFPERPGFKLLCPYDTGTLDPEVIEEARRSHPWTSEGDEARASERFEGTGLERLDLPLDPPPAGARSMPVDIRSLREVRAAAREVANGAGMPDRADGLALAVNEIASNSIEHGTGHASVMMWSSGHEVVAEVRSPTRIADPLAGRLRPTADQTRGRGLWLAHRFCDLVQIRPTEGGGQIIRVLIRSAETT